MTRASDAALSDRIPFGRQVSLLGRVRLGTRSLWHAGWLLASSAWSSSLASRRVDVAAVRVSGALAKGRDPRNESDNLSSSHLDSEVLEASVFYVCIQGSLL